MLSDLMSPSSSYTGTEDLLMDTSAILAGSFWDSELDTLELNPVSCEDLADIGIEPPGTLTPLAASPFTGVGSANIGLALNFPTTSVATATATATQLTNSEEREIELMMQFLGEDFAKQHSCHQSSAMTEKSWLMCILKRSSTFYYASLGTSAYFNFLRAPEGDRQRTQSFREYDQYRDMAHKGYHKLLEADRQGRELQPAPMGFALGETMICSVQMAILEVSRTLGVVSYSYFPSPSERWKTWGERER